MMRAKIRKIMTGKRRAIAIAVALVVVVILIVAVGARSASGTIKNFSVAGPFSAFWQDITHPLVSENSTPPTGTSFMNATSGVALYQPADQYEGDVIAAVNKASPAVVSITISENVPIIENCPNDFYYNLPQDLQQFFGNIPTSTPCDTGKTELQQVGGGSGFIISADGLILTNKHVVSDTGASYSVLTNDGKTYVAKVLARDPNQDLAVLKINATGLPTVTLGDSNGLRLGQSAIAIGNTLGEYSNTVSVGVISGLARTVTASAPDTGVEETIEGVIQTDAAINPGNSGGPLLDLRGDVIGINTAVASNAQSVGFAIPIDQAKSAINSVESTGEIQVPFLGVRYTAVTADLATTKKLPVSYGALVTGVGTGQPAVEPDSPAAKAGFKADDIIESVDGQKIDATHDLGNIINQHNVGDVVTLVVNRAGKELTVQATLAKRP
ncbi:MAG: trypsin-like peptidase domain-containing protein [Candidatus Pacebacteria bacterium]|nr:trypsin-like peptidase domain-containing protein [Candidatus Paceibacterota bacterium]